MKPVLLCLHGWGADHHSFDELRAELKESGVTILTPDLPGCGGEPEPREPWTNDDYADWVEQWIERKVGEVPSIALLGHSHGGRIAIKLTTRGNVNINHLFLCAAAGIKHPRHIKRTFGLTLAKTGKRLLSIPGLKVLQPLGKKLLYKLVRVHDYEKASPVMARTMINVCKEDLRPLLKHIQTPTDIFWGEDDGMTPLSDAFVMQKEIPNALLHTYPGVRHRVHRDRAKEIAGIIAKRMNAP